MTLRVFGYLAWAPRDWDIETSPNGNRQRMTIVAAPTLAAALREFASAGVRVTRSQFGGYGYPDMGGRAEEVALAEPGAVFYQTGTTRGEYVRVPASPSAP